MQFSVVLETVQRIFACLLLALFLGISSATSTFVPIDDDLCVEKRRSVFCLCFIQQNKFQGNLVFLTPLEDLTLEVLFLVGQLVNVYEAMQYLLRYKGFAVRISSVQIDGANECLERISREVAVVHLVVLVAPDKFVEADFCSQLAK